MDDDARNNGSENENPMKKQKTLDADIKMRRSPSPARSNRSDSKIRHASRDSRSKSRSRERSSRRRRSRSRSRGHSQDRRRFDRFNRGGFQRDFYNNRRRRSPSDRRSPLRRRFRNQRNRRSRSQSNDRFRNRRHNRSSSRDRSNSRGAGGRTWKKGPMSPLSPSQMQQSSQSQSQMPNNGNFNLIPPVYSDGNVYNSNYPPNNMGGYMPNQSYSNYEYQVPMLQPPPGPFTAYPPPNVMQPIPPGDDFQSVPWQQPPPPPIINLPAEPMVMPQHIAPVITEAEEEKQKREAAVALEKKNQRATLRKQRDDYKRRAAALKRELKILKEQRDDLVSSNEPPSPTTNGFLKENDRLQAQIENKIGTMDNVIDMLCGIIGDDKSTSESPPAIHAKEIIDTKKSKESPKSDDSSPERLKTKVIESLKKNKSSDRGHHSSDEKHHSNDLERVNYTFYDPELHWCEICSVFPKTAKDFLSHLHSEEHKNKDKSTDIPWHENLKSDDLPTYTNAPNKKTPIRGVQFFVPSTGWYCKLCSIWMGDLHCASAHLKSQTHAKRYTQFVRKYPQFEADWSENRQKAFDNRHIDDQPIEVPPPPPIISIADHPVPPPMVSLTNPLRFLGGIPLQLNQKPKEPIVEESSTKKGKKKKKEKKKRKKSKKKRHSSSSSSSSSSNESSDGPEVVRKNSIEKTIVDTSNSIRVAMRNSLQTARRQQQEKPEIDDGNIGGKWTVIQEASNKQAAPIVPLPPTISANGEAQNRRDDLIISQWNVPEPVISEKEKELLEQLKGRLKNRDDGRNDKKKEESSRSNRNEDDNHTNKYDDDKRGGRYDDRDRRRRDRSVSRQRRRSRSSSKQRRRSRRSRSRSHGRRIEKAIVKHPEFKPRVPDADSQKAKDLDRKKSSTSTSKKSSKTTTATKKLPFIGRMPVFKKQATDEETKKQEQHDKLSEEQRLMNAKKQQELKFQIQQKQQLVQQQQKHAEAYNLAHPGQFASAFNSHGSIHHVLPPVTEDYDDLMPDPLQYVSLMGAPPPPPANAEARRLAELNNEPVLPPGIDEEEAETLQPLSHTPHLHKVPLPQDFQDALSIIFDKGVEKANKDDGQMVPEPLPVPPPASVDIPQDDSSISTFVPMDMASIDSQPEIVANTMIPATMELDEQSQYILYGSMTDKPLVFNESSVAQAVMQQHVATIANSDVLTQNIPTPPIQILDAAGNLTQIPGPVLEVSSNFMTLDTDGNPIITTQRLDIIPKETAYEAEQKKKRMQELDDLAMLGIDAEDMAAQCI